MQKKTHRLISMTVHISWRFHYLNHMTKQQQALHTAYCIYKGIPSFWPEGLCALAHSASPNLLPICAAVTIRCEHACCRLAEPTCLHGTFHADEELQGQRCPEGLLPAVLTAARKHKIPFPLPSRVTRTRISNCDIVTGTVQRFEAAVPVSDALACSHEVLSKAWTYHVRATCHACLMLESAVLLARAGQA